MVDRKTRKLKESTVEVYRSKLIELAKYGIDAHNILDVSELSDIFDTNSFSVSKRTLVLSAIVWHINNCDECNSKQVVGELRQSLKNNNRNKTEKVHCLDWASILKVHNVLDERFQKTIEEGKFIDPNYLMLSLYVLHPPRQVQDYSKMYIGDFDVPNDSTCILWSNNVSFISYSLEYNFDKKDDSCFQSVDKSKNYCVVKGDSMFFVFFDYDNVDTYGPQIIEVINSLRCVISTHIQQRLLKCGDKLFGFDYSTMCGRIGDLFNTILGKKIYVTGLRSMFIDYFLKDDGSNRYTKKVVSYKMVYGKGMRRKHVEYTDEVEDQEDENGLKECNVEVHQYKAPRTVYKVRTQKNNTNVKNMSVVEHKNHVAIRRKATNREYYLRKKNKFAKGITKKNVEEELTEVAQEVLAQLHD